MTTIKDEYDHLVQSVIDYNRDVAREEMEFCNSKSGVYKVIETDIVKIIFSDKDKRCDVRRKENNNPVFCRDEEGNVYRIHGEFNRVKSDLNSLVGR